MLRFFAEFLSKLVSPRISKLIDNRPPATTHYTSIENMQTIVQLITGNKHNFTLTKLDFFPNGNYKCIL